MAGANIPTVAAVMEQLSTMLDSAGPVPPINEYIKAKSIISMPTMALFVADHAAFENRVVQPFLSERDHRGATKTPMVADHRGATKTPRGEGCRECNGIRAKPQRERRNEVPAPPPRAPLQRASDFLTLNVRSPIVQALFEEYRIILESIYRPFYRVFYRVL